MYLIVQNSSTIVSVFPTNLFVEPTEKFVIAFCLTKFFVRTKILLRRQKKFCQFYILLRAGPFGIALAQ